MGGKGGEIVDGIEDDVDGLGDVEVEVVDLCFLGLDLLRSELSIGGEQVGHEITDAAGILAGSSVEEGTEVDRINSINDLSNKSFLGGLAEFKLMMTGGPSVTSSVDLSRGAGGRRHEGTRIARGNPYNGWL